MSRLAASRPRGGAQLDLALTASALDALDALGTSSATHADEWRAAELAVWVAFGRATRHVNAAHYFDAHPSAAELALVRRLVAASRSSA